MKQKRAMLVRTISSAILLMVFSIGSIAAFRPSKDVTLNVSNVVVKASAEKHVFAPFIADAYIVTIPINHIGFYSFVYPAGPTWHNIVLPVAHAPPNRAS